MLQSSIKVGAVVAFAIFENEGKLRKVRLRGETGQVFNPAGDVEALALAAEG